MKHTDETSETASVIFHILDEQVIVVIIVIVIFCQLSDKSVVQIVNVVIQIL